MTYDAKIAKAFNIFLATIHKTCRYYPSLQKRSKIHKKENFGQLIFYLLNLKYSNFNIKYPQTLTIYY